MLESAGNGTRAGMQAVILAGGRGSRLAPYTTVLPKPLLPIGDEPILEVVIRQLGLYGFSDITLAVGYLAHLIEAVLQDGSRHGVSIQYHHELEPLGTVGPLATMDHLDDAFLMLNGDVLTTLDYRAFYAAHIASGNALTLATHVRTVRSDYGVLDLDGHSGATRRVIGFREKPEIDHSVSMGVYILSGHVRKYIPAGERFDLPDLVWRLLEAGEPVGSFVYDGFWLDIGRHDDYAQAIERYDDLKDQLLPTLEGPAAPVREIFAGRFAANDIDQAVPADAALPATGT
jgi:NDP-sugar pyrophosphorylase family protein